MAIEITKLFHKSFAEFLQNFCEKKIAWVLGSGPFNESESRGAARPTMPTSFHQSLSMMELKRGSSPPAMLDLRTSTRASVSSLFWERRSRVTACSLGVEPRLHKTFIFFMMFKMVLVQQAKGIVL